MKFVYYNDTGREVGIYPATETHGTACDMSPIQPLTERIFYLPPDTYPWVKMWDYGEERGLSILISPMKNEVEERL